MLFSHYYRYHGGEKKATGVAIAIRLDFTDVIDNIERRDDEKALTKKKKK